MILQSMISFSRRYLGGPELRDSTERVNVYPLSTLQFDGNGNSFTRQLLSSFTYWELLPAASVAVGTDKLTTLVGGSATVAQSVRGGILISGPTSNTSPASVAGVATSGFSAPFTATNNLIFRTQIYIPTLVQGFTTAGLSTNVAAPTIAVSGADAAQFLADPTNLYASTTGATTAQAANWILCTNVAGTSSYIFTNVPIVAGQDIALQIVLNSNLTYSYFINGALVGTSPIATPATLNANLKVIVGCENASTGLANALEIRYAQFERSPG